MKIRLPASPTQLVVTTEDATLSMSFDDSHVEAEIPDDAILVESYLVDAGGRRTNTRSVLFERPAPKFKARLKPKVEEPSEE